MGICVRHLQDLNQEQQDSAETVASREESLERDIQLDKKRNVDVNIDAPVNPLAAVGCDALKYVEHLINQNL